MVEARLLLLTGDDEARKDQFIHEYKQRFIKDLQGAGAFNIDDADAKNLSLSDCQQILRSLPVGSSQRLLILRNIQNASLAVSQLLISEFSAPVKDLRVIFTLTKSAKSAKSSAGLIAFLENSKYVEKFETRAQRPPRVFDLARNIIEYSDPARAIGLLRQLFSFKTEPVQVLGGLFWYWNNTARKTLKDFSKDLFLFLQTDNKIKHGLLEPHLALEMLVVKLCLSRKAG